MSTIYMRQLSTFPLMEGDQIQQDQGHFPDFTIAKDPPILFPFVISNPSHDQEAQSYENHHLRQHQVLEPHQFNDHMLVGGSGIFRRPPLPFPTVQSIDEGMIRRPSYDPYDIDRHTDGTGRWAASAAKMRIMRKAGDPDQAGAAKKPRRRAQAFQDQGQSGMNQQQQHAQTPVGVIRVCSDCNTTKTPLWRSGPCGPKSLCNACGIRQRKARRAMAAAAAATNGGVVPPTNAAHAKPKKEKRADVDRSLPFKKRCKMVDHGAAAATAAVAKAADVVVPKKTDLLDGIAINVSKDTAFHRAFPHDEITDAAILLMTLSCGLVRS